MTEKVNLSDEDSGSYETDPETLERYEQMAMSFLPTIFSLDAMGDVFFRHLKAANMNAEQAATSMGKMVRANLKHVAAMADLPDVELVKLMNAMGVLLHLRRATIQLVTVDADSLPDEAKDRIEAIMQEGLPIKEMHARVRDIKKEFGL